MKTLLFAIAFTIVGFVMLAPSSASAHATTNLARVTAQQICRNDILAQNNLTELGARRISVFTYHGAQVALPSGGSIWTWCRHGGSESVAQQAARTPVSLRPALLEPEEKIVVTATSAVHQNMTQLGWSSTLVSAPGTFLWENYVPTLKTQAFVLVVIAGIGSFACLLLAIKGHLEHTNALVELRTWAAKGKASDQRIRSLEKELAEARRGHEIQKRAAVSAQNEIARLKGRREPALRA